MKRALHCPGGGAFSGMRFPAPAALLFCAAAASCTPAAPLKVSAPVKEITPSAEAPAPLPSPGAQPPAAVPRRSAAPAAVTRREIAGISFEGVSFDAASHRLMVADQPGGPGSKYPDARSAAASRGGLAAVNAGFFTPQGAPLGKIIADGRAAGSWNRSSLGGGVFTESPAGNLGISRREAVSPGAAQRELLQAGPLLVENGRPVSGLNGEKPAVRTLMLWDGGARWWIGRSSICTLAQLGSVLGDGSPAGWKVHAALNLDGGRSTDLWVSGAVSGGPVNFRPMWNRPVRNFLVLVPR